MSNKSSPSDHIPLEMEIEVEEELRVEVEEKKGAVDWERFKVLLNWSKKWEVWEGLLEGGGRKELDRAVEEAEDEWMKMLEDCKGKSRWRYGKKRWWNVEVEKAYEELRREECSFERGERGKKERERVKEKRREFEKVARRVKGEHWGKYLEELGMNEGYKWIKTDRDFVVDLPPIEVEGGARVEGDEEKGVAIVRGLGKREELRQEEEGFVEKVELEMEEVEEMLWLQKDGKACGKNGLAGKVFKEIWREGKGRGVLRGVYRKSMELGYVPKRFRSSVGIIMRKPNKPDYGLPGSYRVINLLDVWGKGLERLICRRLEKWGKEGFGKEQYGARRGRSSLEAVGKLRDYWERGGERGLLVCMDIKGGYENVGVGKMEERLRELGVDTWLRKWVSSFLREREVVVKIGDRLGERTGIKGGTVQGSPLSPLLFMFLLGGVLDEIRKEEVVGMEMVAVVDDVDFMFMGDGREDIMEKVRRVERGLERGLRKWEVDVQKLKTEGLWMRRMVKEGEGSVKWLGEEVRMMQSVRVLGVWFQSDGGWKEHVKNRIRLAEKKWQMMLKLLGKNGRGMSVKDLATIFRAVVEKCLLYGMEVYWDGNEKIRKRLQVWENRGMRRILGAVMSTPVDAMLGELGWKRIEWELDKKVERWGFRLLRGKGTKGKLYGEELRKRGGEGKIVGENGLVGRLIASVKKGRLEGERWEVEKERDGLLGWKGVWRGTKRERKEGWEKGEEYRNANGVVGLSDASKDLEGVGIGGCIWERGEVLEFWSKNGGCGLTVEGGEMWGVGEILKWVVKEYRGERRKIIVGTDNVGVIKKLLKGRGFCGEMEQEVRRWGRKLIEEEGWEVVWEWVPGHVGVWENELVDELAKCGVYEREEREVGEILMWGEWESRRKKEERIRWRNFWLKERKGEEYFGSGSGGELGHEGMRWISRMLVWLRTNHGAMSGARYFEGRGDCDCGGGVRESRDHFLLYCEKWRDLREEIWRGFERGMYWDEGWVDVERMLFGEKGVKRVIEMGIRSGWKDREWKSGRWSRKEDREGKMWEPIEERLGGWIGGMSEERRRREKEMRNERRKRYRERKRNGLVGS